MDVPAWHPANEDASVARRLRGLSSDAAAKRVEFKVMAGSSADTSTEAGRELLSDMRGEGGGAAWTGRGFFDASDRLYLLEQKRLEQEGEQFEQQQRVQELRQFRSNALKLQASKPVAAAAVPLAPDSLKKPLAAPQASPLVVVRPKKRPAEARGGSGGADASTKSKKKKKKKEGTEGQKDVTTPRAEPRRAAKAAQDKDAGRELAARPQTAEDAPAAGAPAAARAPAALVVGYSSSSESDS